MKKTILFTIVVLCCMSNVYAVVTWNGTTKTAWTQGSGTEADPFIISSPNHLAYLAQQVNAGTTYAGVYFKQTQDFNLNNKMWTSIGTTTYKFAGNYDGNSKYISNLKNSIFGYINNSEIKNLTLQGNDQTNVSAALVNTSYGACKIINCHNTINLIRGSSPSAGGLVAYASGTSLEMISCTNSGQITGYTDSYGASGNAGVGGLIGYSEATILSVILCRNTGDCTRYINTGSSSIEFYLGGLVGFLSSTSSVTIDKCCSTGVLVGLGTENCTILRSYSTGTADNFMIGSGTAIIKGCYMIGTLSNHSSGYGYEFLIHGICSNCYIAGEFPWFTVTSGSQTRWTGDYCFYSPTGSFTPILGSSMYVSTSSIKKTSFIPRINEEADEEYFTMDYEGINGGYPILKWQAGTRYNISATCDANRGSVTGGGEYPNGYTATLTATPKNGCTFVGWSDGNTDNPRTVTVSGEASYIAQFTKSSYIIYVNQDCTGNIE